MLAKLIFLSFAMAAVAKPKVASSDVQMNWEQAAAYCSSSNQSMLTYAYAGQKSYTARNNKPLWLGIRRCPTNNARWIDQKRVDVTEAIAQRFEPGQPDNSSGDENCLVIIANSKLLKDIPCGAAVAFAGCS
ncbi:hypothetical protein Ciccas_004606 [Cichlidogyrus casuarinus]|uniref:C-type lectin domain-containing protein n=1 Tax=Cichlidogyrus casuarinus TaxID=1844966 RepID=A0ABD2QB59_9PLAT